jgi:hypothetical protein
MKYALGNMLNGAGVRGLDTDAKAYIDAVVAAGATVTETQRNAINTFVKGGKTDGWWSSIKRFYLPIWGIAAPNAIDVISRNSGTFVGTPTYGASSVSFASGAYFNTNTSFSGQGVTASSGYIFALATAWTGVGNYLGGSGASANSTLLGRGDSSNLRLRYSGGTEGSGQLTATSNAGTLGIVSGSRQGGDRKLYRRSNTGRSNVATSTSANSGSPPGSNVYFGGYNNSDVGTIPITVSCTLGFFGFGLGLTDAQDSAFTAAMETLWETCTGSTLPT